MRTKFFSLVTLTCALPLTGCFGDETLRGYGGRGVLWQLQEIDGHIVKDATTLSFDRGENVSGTLPCNRFTARLDVPYPWFDLAQMATTRRVCPALGEEVAVLDALQQMQIVEIKGDVMILSNDTGREMVFKAAD
ncbi:META domain-containing protein [Phaeobacter sp. JH20_36]|uniref:META domain-containing protein n=1 Tax=unclassified Phaeobacter TaxID=2621772 RepID=UPI003A8837A0